MSTKITTLFLDIGGVLLTNGWDRHSRQRAAEKFGLNYEDMNDRHHMTFDTYESGKLTLKKYLDRVVFNQPRNFSEEDFKNFMFDQSKPMTEEIEFFLRLKEQHRLVVAAVSNEARELTEHRVQKFDLRRLFDFFISSCFVHLRKPDEEIFRMALDISQARPEEVVYIDDRLMFVEVARAQGIQAIHRRDADHMRSELEKRGLTAPA